MACFDNLPDLRGENIRHPLPGMLFIALIWIRVPRYIALTGLARRVMRYFGTRLLPE